MCMLCGLVCCGRYNDKHAMDHFDLTAHVFVFELNSSRIWNYRGDHFVHRLIKTNLRKQSDIDEQLEEIKSET